MGKLSRAVLAGLSVLMAAGTGWGAEPPRIWAVNLGDKPLELAVEHARGGSPWIETLVVGPEKRMEVRRSGDEKIRVPDHPDLLLVTAPAGFDPASLRIEGVSPGIERPTGNGPAAREKALPERLLTRGEAVSSSSVWTGAGPLATRLSLRGPMTAAEVRVARPEGAPLGYVTLAASRDVEVTVDLRGFLDQKRYWGPVRREVEVRRGEVSTSLEGPVTRGGARGLLKTTVGTGSFNRHYNYTTISGTPALYYSVSGGPASVCGELDTYRNGSWLFTPGWLCTDNLGLATKGPWYTASGNQTDNPAFIRWPDGSTTTNDWHIWDTSCPSISYGSSNPPYSWSGTATDAIYGACFTATTKAYSYYYDYTADLYWTPATGAYSSSTYLEVSNPLSGVPSCNATWATPRPDVTAHTHGHTYRWGVCTDDGGCAVCTPYRQFTY